MAFFTRHIVRRSVPPLCRGFFDIKEAKVQKVTRKAGQLVAQTDASGGHRGGAVGWILRDHNNNCLTRKLVWVPKITESTCLELSGIKHVLYSFSGTGVHFEILNDCKAAFTMIHRVRELLDKGLSASSILQGARDLDKKRSNSDCVRETQTQLALDILSVLKERYEGGKHDVVLKLVRGDHTHLSHHLSNFVRTYFEEVEDVCDGGRFGDFEVWGDLKIFAIRRLKFLTEHSLRTDVVAVGDISKDDLVFSQDVPLLSLGIETMGGLMHIMVPKNAVGPIKVDQHFSTLYDYQECVILKIYEGESRNTKFNRLWGKIEIAIVSAPKGLPKLSVSFDIDTNECLTVTVSTEEEEFVLKGARTTKLTEAFQSSRS